MPTLFTRIVSGEIPCHKICEDNDYLAFLDIRPINPGHTLVIPKQEINYFFDLDDKLLGGLMVFAKRVAAAVRREVECKRIGVMIAGLEVPHAHVHLVPIQELGDLNFAKARPAEAKELARIAARIRAHL
ncbi:MAG: HIT family hydrolase [Omnitrophica WOR_2 bacterium RIFCSPLOWO2_12_FULL_50_9]|nr:MAG: HIT family hydrolase [Omnitrophica WOR_2 bacterium RIFCSPHIGHO2_02_FULL_50_17]OGX40280.1 MAG: HIT family hydrolase [Omnitrophica WOR_2 bacterium RIFCSPLOWO2_12_FULL_50_9]